MKKLFAFLIACVFSVQLISAAETTQTLAIIKPDAVAAKTIGKIIGRFEKADFRIAAIKMTQLSQKQAQDFYEMHKQKPFYNDLVSFMTSGPVVAIVLEAPNAIEKNRELLGTTDPKKAQPGTIRADFGKSITQNAVHGSDSPDSAKREIAFFFQPSELVIKK